MEADAGQYLTEDIKNNLPPGETNPGAEDRFARLEIFSRDKSTTA